MLGSKRLVIGAILVAIAPITLAACGSTPEPEAIVDAVEDEQTKVVEKAGEEVAVVGTVEPGPYRIALFEDPYTTNYWNYLGPGGSVWTRYILADQAPSLYSLADVTFQFVPYLAKNPVEPVENPDGTWSMVVEMVVDAVWSDGKPITAHDVVFTHNACKDLKLTHSWPNQCSPADAKVTAEVVDDFTVKYTFTEPPTLGTWHAGIAQAPILPQHFWADKVAEAYTYIEGLEEPDVEMPVGVYCTSADLSEEEQKACGPWHEAWDPYNEAFANARQTLYEADATGSPSAGGYTTDKWEPGAFAQRTANYNYYFKGAEIVEYEDGTWMLIHPNGMTHQLYGNAEGEETLRFTRGPYAPNIIFSIYGSPDAAFLALADGEVDYVLNPLGLSRGLQEQAQKGEGVEAYVNADYGMYYLAFNMRKYPQSEYEFRQAIDIILDKEFVTEEVLGGVVFPMHSTMPPGNRFWHNPDVPRPTVGWSREERVNEAVRVLKEAGWRWTKEPEWSEELQDVVPGEGIIMPDGKPMPKLTILGPGPAYDPLRATFNQRISEWARELGMPIESELTEFNNMLSPVFIDADFDMYILGWSLGNVAFPNYFELFWHSRNDTVVSGNSNTAGFNNPEYDALLDEFMSTSDLERAREIIFEAQVILADQRPYIPLYYKQTIDLARNTLIFPYTESLGGLEFQGGLQTDTYPKSR
jgi:peptide/nickel transport system substrate-binding protein